MKSTAASSARTQDEGVNQSREQAFLALHAAVIKACAEDADFKLDRLANIVRRIGAQDQRVSGGAAGNASFKKHPSLCQALSAFEACMMETFPVDTDILT